jgi:hypothetical protein
VNRGAGARRHVAASNASRRQNSVARRGKDGAGLSCESRRILHKTAEKSIRGAQTDETPKPDRRRSVDDAVGYFTSGMPLAMS